MSKSIKKYLLFTLALCITGVSSLHAEQVSYLPYTYDEKNNDWFFMVIKHKTGQWGTVSNKVEGIKDPVLLPLTRCSQLLEPAFQHKEHMVPLKTKQVPTPEGDLYLGYHASLPEPAVLRKLNPEYDFVRISLHELLKALETKNPSIKAKSKTFNAITLDPYLYNLCREAYPLLQSINHKRTKHKKKFSLKAWAEQFLKNRAPTDTSCIAYHDFMKTFYKAFFIIQNQLKATKWLNNRSINFDKEFKPFVQKTIVPANSKLFLWGDLHGSAESFTYNLLELFQMRLLDDGLKLKEGCYAIFLGDLIDRARYGVELLYLMMSFKIKNPDQVFFVRGNHDVYSFNSLFHSPHHRTFQHELITKFPQAQNIDREVYSLFEYFPLALYIGSGTNVINFMQCCHGALELGYNPKLLLHSDKQCEAITTIDRAAALKGMLNEPHLKKPLIETISKERLCDFTPTGLITPLPGKKPSDGLKIGLTWHEFISTNNDSIIDTVSERKKDREFVYGCALVNYFLKSYSSDTRVVRLIARGHQHHDTMLKRLKEQKGCLSLFDGKVLTLFSGRQSVGHEKFPYDAFTCVTTGSEFKDWQISKYYRQIS